jgi:oligopeptide/dipeptide ABC transporter ATP-binding protein
MKDLQSRHGMSIVLITHDLGVVAGMADRVHVMYAGRLVETGRTRPIFRRPLHPYTRGLLASVPRLDSDPDALLSAIAGSPPDPLDRPAGCASHPRCTLAKERCGRELPELDEVRSSEGERRSACFEVRELQRERAL